MKTVLLFIVAAFTAALSAPVFGAIVTGGFYLTTDSSDQSDFSTMVQSAISANGNLSSVELVSETSISDMVTPKHVVDFFLIQRESGETNYLALAGVTYSINYTPDSAGIDNSGNLSARSYDDFAQGFLNGVDGVPFTSDDTAITSGSNSQTEFDYLFVSTNTYSLSPRRMM